MDRNHPSSRDFPDHLAGEWVDPADERARLRRRLRRCGAGFSLLGLALVVACLSTLGFLILIFSGRGVRMGALLGVPHWELIEESTVVFGSLLGVCLLWGRWPDQNWLRRSGLLLMMCLVDLVLWSLDHAHELGLTEAKFGHDWFRSALGNALGWSEFALIASLAADMAGFLGEPQAVEFGKATRSLATTGAMVWFMFFYFQTDWKPPLWPLRIRPFNVGSQLLFLGTIVLIAINLVQVSALTLLAGRSCHRALREMAIEDRKHDLPPSRSEAGWEEFNRPGPKV